VTLKSGLEVIQTGTIQKPGTGCGFLFVFHSNYVTMAVSLTVYEIIISTSKYSVTLKTGLWVVQVIENGAVR